MIYKNALFLGIGNSLLDIECSKMMLNRYNIAPEKNIDFGCSIRYILTHCC